MEKRRDYGIVTGMFHCDNPKLRKFAMQYGVGIGEQDPFTWLWVKPKTKAAELAGDTGRVAMRRIALDLQKPPVDTWIMTEDHAGITRILAQNYGFSTQIGQWPPYLVKLGNLWSSRVSDIEVPKGSQPFVLAYQRVADFIARNG